MSTPIDHSDWLSTCPDLLEGLVDAVRICSLQVSHPLCLRKNQPPLTRDALLLKQMPKKQTGFVLLLKQNISDLVILHRNQNKSNMF